MAHLDLANLRTTLLDDTQLAAVALHRTFAGHLPVNSGHLVVCDPLVQAEAPALADYTAPLGRHPVEVIVHSGRPALAVVWFKAPRSPHCVCPALADGALDHAGPDRPG
ncbi:MAG: hypothetical protein PBU97_14360 [Stenotrophomonas maltophilia]